MKQRSIHSSSNSTEIMSSGQKRQLNELNVQEQSYQTRQKLDTLVEIPSQPTLPLPIQNSPNPGNSQKLIATNQQQQLIPTQKQIKCFINKPSQIKCTECGQYTETIQRLKTGQTAYLWSVCLLFTTGVCCFLPFFDNRCKDKEMICIRCCAKKQTKRADIFLK